MKNGQILKFVLTGLFVGLLIMNSFAQDRKKGSKGVSEADQKAIIELFSDVDQSEYLLVFKDGQEVYGKKSIQMSDLRTVSKQSDTIAKGVKWTFIIGDRSKNEVFYIYSEGASKMVSLLGRKKFAALQKIANKYNDIQ